MKKKSLLSIIFSVVFVFVYGQKDSDIVFKVAETPVTVSEFKHVFEKNLDLITDDNQKEVENYLQLYINFKLKLHEALRLQLDTTRAYKREIETYKNQLTAPYLQDSTFLAKLIKDAYFRTKYKVNASHVLIKLPKGILPKDTLKFYTKIHKAREEVLSGIPFATVASKYSDDQSVKSNFGNLGYFTAFKMVYPFENAVYKTKVGEVSKPFKTRFGYHFVKVNDLQLSEGEIEVAHILITDKTSRGKQKIDSIYRGLVNGANFAKLVLKYSNDKSTVSNEGRLPKFGVGRMMKTFEDNAFKLRNVNELSKPFATRFGWHIIKLLKKHPVKSFNEMKKELASKVRASGGARMSDFVVLKRLKKQYKIVVNETAKKIFSRKDIRGENRSLLTKTIVAINEKAINQSAFFDYIRNRRHKTIGILFEEFLDQEVLNYFKENLSKTEPKFARTLQEYKEGLLVFDIMQKRVWNKSVTDSIGMQTYFNTHKAKYTFSKVSTNKGMVMNDYQHYLEKKMEEYLKRKYAVKVKKRILKKLIKYYSKNE